MPGLRSRQFAPLNSKRKSHGPWRTIRIRTDDGVLEFERSELVAMIPGAGRERDYWSLKLSLGLSGQAGNTNQLSLNAQAKLARETSLTRARFDYVGNMATQDSEISANNHRGTIALDVFLTRRFFLVVPVVEAFQDEFQNIELRLTPAVGLGYNILYGKEYKWQWDSLPATREPSSCPSPTGTTSKAICLFS